MLISYRFNNFCSFYGENEFDMVASGGKVLKRFPDNYIEADNGYALLKTAVIVGENAGGKSNFMKSIQFLKSIFSNTEKVKSVRSYLNSWSLQKEEPYQEFELAFMTDNAHIYIYKLILDEMGIQKESLHVAEKKSQKQKCVMEVKRDEKNYRVSGGNTEELLNRIVLNTQGDMGLYITKIAMLGNEDAAAAVKWINQQLYTEALISTQNTETKQLEEDLRILRDERYIDVFRMVDYSICSIELDEVKPYTETIIVRKDGSGKTLRRKLELDSTGVREFFAWAVRIFRVVYEDKIVFADEMDRVLNPILAERVIAFINGKRHKGQFIFSTHNVLHLDLRTYMKEQIYFITKDNKSLISELYSLADFPEVRYQTTKIYEFYMKGILGGTAFE